MEVITKKTRKKKEPSLFVCMYSYKSYRCMYDKHRKNKRKRKRKEIPAEKSKVIVKE
jgi:hypothetical protein